MDKIYSRPRIRLNVLSRKPKGKKQKFNLRLIFILLFIFIILFIKASYPVFVASCENAASSVAINIMNKEVNEVMLVYNYNDLVNLGKDDNRKYYIYRSKNNANK